MVELLQQTEAIPSSYPAVPSGLSTKALALDADTLWTRIEGYIAHRFTEREVVWTIEGHEHDEWTPPLAPLISQTAEKWESGAWETVTLQSAPLGFCLPSDGVFKITAQVGAGPVPALVSEAFRRLAEYSVEIGTDSMVGGHMAHAKHDVKIGERFQEGFSRTQMWAAKAIQLSGAADMLRLYRRA